MQAIMPELPMGRESRFLRGLKLMESYESEQHIIQETWVDLPQRAEWLGDERYFGDGKLGKSMVYVPPQSFYREDIQATKRRACMVQKDNKLSDHTDFFSLLPDEILIEIFGHIPMARDRSVCSLICKRWVILQSHMRMSDMKMPLGTSKTIAEEISGSSSEGSSEAISKTTAENNQMSVHDVKWEKQPHWASGDLSRCLEGRKATDIRLASIAVGTSAFGGLGKLSIKGGKGENSAKAVSDFGLSAIGISCRALKCLLLWDCPNIGDQGLISIGEGCGLLEKLDLIKCPQVGNGGLEAIARGCPLLSSLSLDSCAMIGSTGLEAVGKHCVSLRSLSVNKCPTIRDEGIVTVVQNCKFLRVLKLEKVGITDDGLALVGKHCNSLIKLILSELEDISEEGFGSFGSSTGLENIKFLCITSCQGVSNNSLCVIGGVCKNLKAFSLVDSQKVTDEGLEAFAMLCGSLEVLRLERCQNISGSGLRSPSSNTLGGLRELHLNKCYGLLDSCLSSISFLVSCFSIKSISITHCEGVGNQSLEKIGFSCPLLENLDLSGLFGVSDTGILAFLQGSGLHLLSVNLTGCKNLTDKSVCAIASHSGSNLQSLYLERCEKVTDRSIKVIAEKCSVLQDLDLSNCKITDAGVLAILATRGPTLKTLSLSGCEYITEECLCVIQKVCESLFALNLKGCTQLSINALESFKSQLWKCDILST